MAYGLRSLVLAALVVALPPSVFAQRARVAEHWVGTWATAVVARAPQPEGSQGRAAQPAPLNFANQTLREIVHTSIGGGQVRVVLSNAFGTAPLSIGAVHLALRDKDAAIIATSDRALTFSGTPTTIIPPGAVVVSDPATLAVPPLADVAVDMFLPGDTTATTSPLTIHTAAHQTNYVSTPGNYAGKPDLPVMTTTTTWFFLSCVEVSAPERTGAVAVLGDSITDGSRSTDDANKRWPDQLAKRLGVGILNAGIAGNRVLSDGPGANAVARLDRDVLVQPGVTHVIVMEGINDVGRGASAAEVIAAYRQLIERAHTRGLKVFGATLTPMEDTTFAGYFTPEHEAVRQALNQWILTSKAYDGVIDFDAVVRDPSQPTTFQPQFVADDKLHPNDAGYEAMGKAVDLKLFTKADQRNTTSTR